MEQVKEGNNQIISYQLLRMFISIIGILLPLILFLGQWIQSGYRGIATSLSASCDTPGRFTTGRWVSIYSLL